MFNTFDVSVLALSLSFDLNKTEYMYLEFLIKNFLKIWFTD